KCTPSTLTSNFRQSATQFGSSKAGSITNSKISRKRRNKVPVPKNDPKATEAKAALAKSESRKPWKKKTPVEVVLEQADKLKAEMAEAEEELKAKRGQLEKFEQAKKLFEGA